MRQLKISQNITDVSFKHRIYIYLFIFILKSTDRRHWGRPYTNPTMKIKKIIEECYYVKDVKIVSLLQLFIFIS